MNPTDLTGVFAQGGFALVAIAVLVWQLRWFMNRLTIQLDAMTKAMLALRETLDGQQATLASLIGVVQEHRKEADNDIGSAIGHPVLSSR